MTAHLSPLISVALVICQLALVAGLVFGRIAKSVFAPASVPIVVLVVFFWLQDRITEYDIPVFGSIKTAVDQATKYAEDIKNIKADVERQQREAAHAVEALSTEVTKARAEAKAISSRVTSIEPRRLSNSEMTALWKGIQLPPGVHYKAQVAYEGCGDCGSYVRELEQIFGLAGWELGVSQLLGNPVPGSPKGLGIFDFGQPTAAIAQLKQALDAAKIGYDVIPRDPRYRHQAPDGSAMDVEMLITARLTPQ